MPISRSVLLACVLAVSASPFLLHAQDNEAQIKARQALEEKMREMQIQNVPTENPPAVSRPAKPSTPPPAPSTDVKADKAAQKEAARIERERRDAEVRERKQAEADARAKEKADAKARAEETRQRGSEVIYQTPPPTVSNNAEVITREQAAAKAEMDALVAKQRAEASAAESQNTKGIVSSPAPQYTPLEVPPSSLTGSKQQRLQQLLQQYNADQITPQQYHEQRAKIIAEP
ncbi:MAG: hypothetical protein QOD03_43 [Verrucomicrobiota bacterium]|jgi:hypothetical protein